MSIDVVDLRSFYSAPLGRVARRFIGRIVAERWKNCSGLSILGVGYATPYIVGFRDQAVRVLAFMPAEQGVVNWPSSGLSSSALVETTMMPLPDASMDRILVIHALEITEHPRQLLSEIWRILTPGGRIIVVAPSRRGLWARFDATPFGHGQPFSKSQLRDLMRDTLFSPNHWGEALYVPPFERRIWLSCAPAFERVGNALALPGAGVFVVEATKQLYRPIGVRKFKTRALPQLEPALLPGVGRSDASRCRSLNAARIRLARQKDSTPTMAH